MASYDEESGVVTTLFDKAYSNRTIDNLSPAVLLTADKKVMCAYPQDTAAQKVVHIRVSDAAEDISSFETNVTVNVGGSAAYNVQLLESSGKYYLFCRISDGAWAYSTSEDGVTWSAVKRFLSESKMRYNCKFVATTADGIIRALMCSEPDGTNPEIRMGFLDTSDSKVYSDAGLTTDVTSAVNKSGSVTKLFENFPVVLSPEEGMTQSLLDAAVTAPEAPRFIVAEFKNEAGVNYTKYKLYDSGMAFAFTESESALLDPNVQLGAVFRGPNDIAVAVNVNGKDYINLFRVVNRRAEISEFLYNHDASETRAARPVIDDSGKTLMWLEGTYTSSSNYNTSVRLMRLDSMTTPDVSIDNDLFFYNGSVQKPAVTVAGLSEGTDYDIDWSDPESKEIGKYSFTIKFKAGQPDISLEYEIAEDPYKLSLDAPQPARTWGDFEPEGGFCPNTKVTVKAASGWSDSAWVGIYQASDEDYRRDNCFAWASVKAANLDEEAALLDLARPAEGEVYNDGFLNGGCYKAVLFEDGTYDKPHCEVIFFILGRHSYEAENITYVWSDDKSAVTARATCTFCDKVEEETVTTTSAVTTEPTCTEPGVRTYTAAFESGVFEAQTATGPEAALDHDWGEWTEAEPSTCIKNGQLVRECKRDPGHKEYKQAELAAHSLEKTDAVAATCTEGGSIEFWRCAVCGKLFSDAEGLTEITENDIAVAALGHDYQIVPDTAKAATSKAEGKEADQKCSRCGDVITGAVIPKLEPTEEEKAAEAAKDELVKAADEAKKIEQGNYTDESFKALQDAIAAAEALAGDENATKEQFDAAAAKIAEAKAALAEKEPAAGSVVEIKSNTYKVTSNPGAKVKTVAFAKAKNTKTVSIPATVNINGVTYKVTSVAAKAFKGSKATTAYIGTNVRKLDKYAFRYSKVKTLVVKSKLLSKTRVKGSLKYSKVATVKTKVSTKKSVNKKYVKKFKSYFTKKNAGKKVTVK